MSDIDEKVKRDLVENIIDLCEDHLTHVNSPVSAIGYTSDTDNTGTAVIIMRITKSNEKFVNAMSQTVVNTYPGNKSKKDPSEFSVTFGGADMEVIGKLITDAAILRISDRNGDLDSLGILEAIKMFDKMTTEAAILLASGEKLTENEIAHRVVDKVVGKKFIKKRF